MSTAAARGTDAPVTPTVAANGNGAKLKSKLLAAAGKWLIDRPAILIVLVLALGIPGYVPGYFELERSERRELNASHVAAQAATRQAFLEAQLKIASRLGESLDAQTRAIDDLARELRRRER